MTSPLLWYVGRHLGYEVCGDRDRAVFSALVICDPETLLVADNSTDTGVVYG